MDIDSFLFRATAPPTSISLEDLTTITVQFKTQLAQLELPSSIFTVPLELNRYALSELVHSFTDQDAEEEDDDEDESMQDEQLQEKVRKSKRLQPYDFLINDEFLRGTLKSHCIAHRLSPETTLVIEVILALQAPKQHSSRLHPDWIASIASSTISFEFPETPAYSASFVLTGCYDSCIRLHPVLSNGKTTKEADGEWENPVLGSGHVGAIKAVKILPRASATTSSIPFAVSGGKDKTIHLWELTTHTDGSKSEASKPSYSLKSVAVGKSHSDSVEALAVCPGTELFASGGFDRKIIFWNPNRSKEIENTSAAALRRAKRLRMSEDAGDQSISSSKSSNLLIPIHTLNAHTDVVTSLCFPFPTTLFSASLDRSVRQFDVTQGEQVNSWHGQLSINALAVHELGYVLATAHSDGTIRLRDTRADRVESGNSILRSHTGWVSDLHFSPLQSHMLVSGSYDKSVKLWDLRAKIPLSTLNSHTDKVLSVDWTEEDVIVSGGSDRQLKSHRWERR